MNNKSENVAEFRELIEKIAPNYGIRSFKIFYVYHDEDKKEFTVEASIAVLNHDNEHINKGIRNYLTREVIK